MISPSARLMRPPTARDSDEANCSYMIAPSWTDNVLSAPILGPTQETSVGYSDLYVQPINLGWHTPRTDYTAGLGLFAPTGRFDFDADDNLGMGMWSVELFGGTTVYFDAAQTWHFAIMGFYEMHSKKEGTDLRVGDIMTLEGGLGKSFMQGALTAGLSYYAQWKVTDDYLGTDATLPEQFNPGRNRGFGIDPEITLPPMTKRSIFSFFNLRYFWETGNRSTVEGQTLVASLTFPIPSAPID